MLKIPLISAFTLKNVIHYACDILTNRIEVEVSGSKMSDGPSNEFEQLKKHPELLTKAKLRAWCFSASEIKSCCYTELQSYITPHIYNQAAA